MLYHDSNSLLAISTSSASFTRARDACYYTYGKGGQTRRVDRREGVLERASTRIVVR